MTRNVEMISSVSSIGNDVHELIPEVGILPLNGLHKEVPPERGAFFRL